MEKWVCNKSIADPRWSELVMSPQNSDNLNFQTSREDDDTSSRGEYVEEVAQEGCTSANG